MRPNENPIYRLTPALAADIERRRKALGRTVTEMARRAGITPGSWLRIETGEPAWSRAIPTMLSALREAEAEAEALPPEALEKTVTPALAQELAERRAAIDASLAAIADRAGCSIDTVRRVEIGAARRCRHLPAIRQALSELEESQEEDHVRWARQHDNNYVPTGALALTPRIASYVHSQRKALGLTQRELAQLCALSDESLISRIERCDGHYSYVLVDVLETLGADEIKQAELSFDGRHCARCGTKVYPTLEEIPPNWPPSHHLQVDALCLECVLERAIPDARDRNQWREEALRRLTAKEGRDDELETEEAGHQSNGSGPQKEDAPRYPQKQAALRRGAEVCTQNGQAARVGYSPRIQRQRRASSPVGGPAQGQGG